MKPLPNALSAIPDSVVPQCRHDRGPGKLKGAGTESQTLAWTSEWDIQRLRRGEGTQREYIRQQYY
ncbi:hypothetical protein M407DRAFT_154135 [Tulasnella calospora MUT 4182]|uniref:Uncharacterized protein n=1 Tax=Tulasnella calospora MUT 4182 TaxID=1051891 RepID=A0A0C3L9D5_9AGAM|nr:hypothetical protein M407DRAFT_154135 [Tulasnella calospora MUT 4182]